jgi:hypothetical protein
MRKEEISLEGPVVSGSSTAPEIEVQWSEANGYAMVFISATKPSERSAHQKDSNADTPDCKHSHYRDRHGVDFDQTEGL